MNYVTNSIIDVVSRLCMITMTKNEKELEANHEVVIVCVELIMSFCDLVARYKSCLLMAKPKHIYYENNISKRIQTQFKFQY